MAYKRKMTLVSWSSGKDSAWALHLLRQRRDIEVVGLFTTITAEYHRVTMHAVRLELVRRQAAAAGLPLHLIEIPSPCSDEQYGEIMRGFIDETQARSIQNIAFGDLFLEEVRSYRETRLRESGIKAIFPLWKLPTEQLAREMIAGGLRAIVTSVDPRQLPAGFIGRPYDLAFLADLPPSADPCGENGEFHTCVIDGPMFDAPLQVTLGEIVERDGFIFADLLPGLGPGA